MKWKNTFNDNSDKVNNEIKKETEYQSTSRLFFIFRRSSKFSIKKGLKFYSQSLNLFSIDGVALPSVYHSTRIDKMQVPWWRSSCHRHWLSRQLRSLPDRTDVSFIDCSFWTQMALRITAPRIRSGIGAQRVFSSSSSFENISFCH